MIPSAAEPHLERLLDRLDRVGIGAPVLDAFRRVQRHDFVDQFIARPAGAAVSEPLRTWVVDHDQPDDETLAAIYHPDHALALRTNAQGRVTSTASAPALVAGMLERLAVQPAQRVLEIGTGSGYNAALLAHLVGPTGHVTTIDIDAGLVNEAEIRFERLGITNIEAIAADGFFGAPTRAPFDRIVATVGCTDLSPHWLAQLAPEGEAAIPLQYGGLHPVVRIVADGAGGASGRVVSNAAFVTILGELEGQDRWMAPGRLGPTKGVTYGVVPEDVVAALDGAAPSDVSFFVSLLDPRSAHTLSMNDGAGSKTHLDNDGNIGHSGPAGAELADALLTHVRTWRNLGRPTPVDAAITWHPVGAASNETGTWTIRRRHFVEHITL